MALDLMAAFTELPQPIDYVLPNMVAGTVGALVSPGGAGKSMLILQLAAQIAGGPDLLDVGDYPSPIARPWRTPHRRAETNRGWRPAD
ncbi:hypothetical protein G6F57_022401 [Rhizopus arrhizus]|nr:hypothetical protein G6F65_022413 [Rhizopus arrhizus]KAG1433120.1 hypothetical protein G6F57_022401 [Rhizopus arrhizus]